ncbi:hypothetical protein JW698_01180, partial [Candidatus Wolfebacteria bacterium]|nr:hypothetical protein [Candidatus Wolfebacteria bacterium]
AIYCHMPARIPSFHIFFQRPKWIVSYEPAQVDIFELEEKPGWRFKRKFKVGLLRRKWYTVFKIELDNWVDNERGCVNSIEEALDYQWCNITVFLYKRDYVEQVKNIAQRYEELSGQGTFIEKYF